MITYRVKMGWSTMSWRAISKGNDPAIRYSRTTQQEIIMENVVLAIVLTLIVVLILREITCWYFKFNAILECLTEIRDILRAGREGDKDKISY